MEKIFVYEEKKFGRIASCFVFLEEVIGRKKGRPLIVGFTFQLENVMLQSYLDICEQVSSSFFRPWLQKS